MIVNTVTKKAPRIFIIMSLVLIILICSIFVIIKTEKKTDALTLGSNFQAGRIIDDGVFYNNNSMSVGDIQSYLNSKVPNCDTNGSQMYNGSMTNAQYAASRGWPRPAYVCLKNYYQVPRSDQNINNLSTNVIPQGAISAAQIIKNASDAYGVSPKVLLVTLQKESLNLIGDSWPLPNQYRNAMGYGCPDTAPCDPQYEGFYNQMTNAARQFKLYKDNSGSYRYKPNQNNLISYQANAPSCGASNVYISSKATAGLYNYTPYQPNKAALDNMYGTGDSCSAYGNRNFFRYYTDMFGSPILPTIFKVSGDPSIYVQSAGYKFYAPTTSILNDYGFGTGAQVVSPNDAASIPLGSTGGMSTSLTNVVKSPSTSDEDGGAIYLISNGKRYLFRTAQQMADFGYSTSDAAVLPYNLISSVPDGGVLSNYIKTSNSSVNIFQVNGGTKRLILDAPTLHRLDTDGSISDINASISDTFTSGVPLSDNPTLLGIPNGAYYVLTNGAYYYIPTPEILSCWNFNGIQVNSFSITRETDISPIQATSTLDCSITINSNTSYFIDGHNRISIPVSYGISVSTQTPSDIITLSERFSIRSTPLKQAVQEAGSHTVWYLEDNVKKVIPTPTDLQLLGISSQNIDIIPKNSLTAIPQSGIKFGVGQVVRNSNSGAVYLITSPNTKSYISTPEDYTAYNYSWDGLQATDGTNLDRAYTTEQSNLSPYMYLENGGIYLIDQYGCYGLLPSDTTAYGVPTSISQSGQTYNSNIFPYLNLSKCSYASVYVKSPNDPAVYLITNGTKRLFNSWAALQRVSQQTNPRIITISTKNLNSLSNGSPISN